MAKMKTRGSFAEQASLLTGETPTARKAESGVSLRRTCAFVAPYVIPRTRESQKLAALSIISTVLYKASLFLPGISGKVVVDALSDKFLAPGAKSTNAMFGVSLYFLGRLGAAFFSSTQNVTYEQLNQEINRRFGARTYEHLVLLDVSYHARVSSGKSVDIMNRGIAALSVILRVVVLQLLPTAFEAVVVSGIFFAMGTRVRAFIEPL